MSPIYCVRLLFEWGGGSVWCGNEAAIARFDVGPIEGKLPLMKATLTSLAELSAWHDKALDWSDPSGLSPWNSDEFKRFESAASSMQRKLQSELGCEYVVVYEPLG
ncbi:MAG: hypothetical protein EOP81_04125 [Variovorax sp.]|nr:MAG: hypothetical protein EOP81_04125 [Variovorax sp.]